MPTTELTDWLDEHTRPNILWYLKRLSANDTQANETHQAGPYIPKSVLFEIFPSLNKPEVTNPDVHFDLVIDSHVDARTARAVWYNNLTRDETRITRLGGANSALLDPESTGSLTVFAFHTEEGSDALQCNVWVCSHGTEEDIIEERVGPVEPGQWRLWSVNNSNPHLSTGPTTSCWLRQDEIPEQWLDAFPSTVTIVQKALALRPGTSENVDRRLISRRNCEFEIFRSVEEAVEFPRVRKGFASLNEFISHAQMVLQRRKSRSGRSLELHVREIFLEEELKENRDFAWHSESEPHKEPDFLFPNAQAYKNPNISDSKLRMLAVKTTAKDRWRQILNEADRINPKHLLTLQEGVSEKQFKEMSDAGVRLVVPTPLHSKYPKPVREHLQGLESFIADVRLLK